MNKFCSNKKDETIDEKADEKPVEKCYEYKEIPDMTGYKGNIEK